MWNSVLQNNLSLIFLGWLLNDTLKNNILFGKRFDQKKYLKTIKLCELKQDIDILPAGDETEIGEKGKKSNDKIISLK